MICLSIVFFFWSLYCLSFDLRLLITPLVSFGHCVVCPSIYGFWLPLWYLLVIVLSVLRFTASDYTIGIFWSLCCLSFDLRLLTTVWYLLVIVLSVLRFTASDYPFSIFKLLLHIDNCILRKVYSCIIGSHLISSKCVNIYVLKTRKQCNISQRIN